MSLSTRKCSWHSTDTVSEFHAEVPQANMGIGLAQGPYMAARAGFKPTTLRTKGAESTNEPPSPMWWLTCWNLGGLQRNITSKTLASLQGCNWSYLIEFAFYHNEFEYWLCNCSELHYIRIQKLFWIMHRFIYFIFLLCIKPNFYWITPDFILFIPNYIKYNQITLRY